jgi:hypothetical protein
MVAREVVGLEEEEHPAAALTADSLRLLFGCGPREQQRRPRPARRPDQDPALTVAERRVLDELEAEYPRKYEIASS